MMIHLGVAYLIITAGTWITGIVLMRLFVRRKKE